MGNAPLCVIIALVGAGHARPTGKRLTDTNGKPAGSIYAAPTRLYPVGRLDKDSEGLLLMTNDGAFAQAVTHPSGGISKLYRVTVQPRADEAQILKLIVIF